MTEREFEKLLTFLRGSAFWRQRLLARLSCAETQHGHHIDTLATGIRAEPAQNLPAEGERQ